ncbi:MAG: radical SAM protein [Candidatus Omnitrophica bacterium]|nr:radical SAM protein [Candidatus Omnitrophota bacterium]MDD5771406.1 radical SAM protein [Candidatus Omnitrophota bacterium]
MANTGKIGKKVRDFKFWLSRKICFPLVSPDVIQIPMTGLCNLRCRMCSLNGSGAKDLPIDKIKNIIDQAAGMGIKEAVLTGGEPFLRHDIFDILEYCRLKGMHWVITTNGTLIDKALAQRLSLCGGGHLHFSLEGLEKTNDFFRGESNFKKTCEAIKTINSLRNKNGFTLSVGVACTVMEQNLEELFGLLEYSDAIGVDVVNFQPLLKNNFNTPERGDSEFWISSGRTGLLDEVIKKIGNYRFRHASVHQEPDLRLLNKYYLKTLSSRDWKCFGGYKTIFICVGDDGSPLVYTCHGICGNLNEVSLKGAWISDTARELRRKSKRCRDLCLQSCYSRQSSSSLLNIFRRDKP